MKKSHLINAAIGLGCALLLGFASHLRHWLANQPELSGAALEKLSAPVRTGVAVGRMMQGAEWLFYDMRFRLRGRRAPHPDVVIIAIDDTSINKLGAWPWSRKVHAQLIEKLAEKPPKALVFDEFFANPSSNDPAGDQALAQATQGKPWVVHALSFYTSPDGQAFNVDTPYPALLESMSAAAAVNAYPDADGALRRAQLYLRVEGEPIPLISLAGANLKRGRAFNEVDAEAPLDAQGRMLVDFPGPEGTFPTYPYAAVLGGQVTPETFQDKVVLLGSEATGVFDHYPTATSSLMPGVEFHAAVVDNLISGRRLRAASVWLTDIALLVMILLSGALLSRLSIVLGIVGALGSMVVYFIIAQLTFSSGGMMLDVAGPLLGLALVHAGVTIHRLFTEEKEKRWIRGVFGQYVSPKVLELLMNNPEKLSTTGDRREATIFFSDVAGFTTISEGLKPDELVAFINQYLSAMSDVVFQCDGYLNKYIGDGIMSFWNAPIEQPDHAVLACRCALQSMARLKELNQEFEAKGRQALKVRIGLNTGIVVVGNVGSARKMDYTVMGDPVNLAARLEAANKPFGTSIMISEFTHAKVSDHFETRYLDCIRVPGKSQPIKTYELLCEKGQLSPEQKKGLTVYDEAVTLFTSRRFAEAEKWFADAAVLFGGEDRVCSIYIERARIFKDQPPPADWDGVFQVHNK
jgi:adenylate cyclase